MERNNKLNNDLEDLRLISNPLHLKVKVIKTKKENKNYIDILKNTISIKYPNFYLSDDNLKDISIFIDNYIKNINIIRIIDSLLNEIIEKVIEENKFDFYLPFD